MEGIVYHGVKVIPATFQLFAGGQDLLRHLVLLDIHPPGVDESDDEEDGQYAVEQDLERVIIIGGNVVVIDFIVNFGGADLAQGRHHGQPVAAGQDHVADEYNFK